MRVRAFVVVGIIALLGATTASTRIVQHEDISAQQWIHTDPSPEPSEGTQRVRVRTSVGVGSNEWATYGWMVDSPPERRSVGQPIGEFGSDANFGTQAVTHDGGTSKINADVGSGSTKEEWNIRPSSTENTLQSRARIHSGEYGAESRRGTALLDVSPIARERTTSGSPCGKNIPLVWCRIADCESGDGDGKPPYRPNWRYNVGTYDGGLNFHPSTWTSATKLYGNGSRKYRYAWQAPAMVQVNVAKRWLKATSWLQWPACSAKVGVR